MMMNSVPSSPPVAGEAGAVSAPAQTAVPEVDANQMAIAMAMINQIMGGIDMHENQKE